MINKFMPRFQRLCLVTLLTAAAQTASAFALLGPFAPWMVAPLAYQVPNAIGGPMLIGEGYRWNVPVITYGFDQSFLDYFGSNGVAAVEGAIQILNDLPPASQINLTNYALKSSRVNFVASSENLLDLKSQTLAMLVEQLGLAQPTAYSWCLRSFSYDPNGLSATYSVENRNYDPVSLRPSPYVNNNILGYRISLNTGNGLYQYDIGSSNASHDPYPASEIFLPAGEAYAEEYSSNPLTLNSAVADSEPGAIFYGHGLPVGTFFSVGFTRDDAGGLAYLYSTNNIALENLLPGVRGSVSNVSNYVGKALRPGVDKITFQRMDYLSPLTHEFAAVTNQYVDTYITNGVAQQQTLERVIHHPDILFTSIYVGGVPAIRTGTTNWVNNGFPDHDGPGIIQPPVAINFDRLGPSLIFGDGTYPPTYSGQPVVPIWSSFDGTTNAPIVFPAQATNATEFHFLLLNQSSYVQTTATRFTWDLPGLPNSLVSLQTSTNLSDWLTLATITNQGGTFTYEDLIFTNSPQRYFRTVPQ